MLPTTVTGSSASSDCQLTEAQQKGIIVSLYDMSYLTVHHLKMTIKVIIHNKGHNLKHATSILIKKGYTT